MKPQKYIVHLITLSLFLAGCSSEFGNTSSSNHAKCRRCKPIEIASVSEFEVLVLENELPVVIEFWAPWSGPCLEMSNVVKRLARENRGKVSFAKVNIDECVGVAEQYNVNSLPSFLYLKNGDVIHSSQGLKSLEEFRRELEMVLQ